MKVRAYVLIVSVALLGMSVGSEEAELTEGVDPGDLALGIEFLGDGAKASFHNQLGRYTLLNFQAAYDMESRARNVQLANEVNKFDPDKIAICSISTDEKESIFTETVKTDKLDLPTQFHEGLGKESELYKKYDLRKGFRNFLTNDEGVITAADVIPRKLAEVLRTVQSVLFSEEGCSTSRRDSLFYRFTSFRFEAMKQHVQPEKEMHTFFLNPCLSLTLLDLLTLMGKVIEKILCLYCK